LNPGSLLDSTNYAKKILKAVGVFKSDNKTRKMTLNNSKFSDEFIKISQKNDYSNIYKTAMEYSDYDFILKDDSFFQFSCTLNGGDVEKGSIRYSYYQNPLEYPTYEDFLEQNGFLYEECRDEFILDYEQEIAESKLKENVTYIRYDYDYALYEPVHHPISHIHFGHNNNIRVAVSKILTPEKFVIFILRNIYNKDWDKLYKSNNEFKKTCINGKKRCKKINHKYFSREERKLLYIE
jgi:hypothetical protein